MSARECSNASCAWTTRAARDEGGSGLGLAIVAELVHAHGGTVTIGESPQGGARVVVRMPAFSGESG